MRIKKLIFGPVILIAAAVIWGASFIFQRNCMSYIGPWTLSCLRMYIGFLFLLPFSLRNMKRNSIKLKNNKSILKSSIIIGFCLIIGTVLQQYGLKEIEAGKVGFITALYMVLVPIFELAIGEKIHLNNWISVGLGTIGLYFICIGKAKDFSLGIGEILTFLCAFAFAFHILSIDIYGNNIDPIILSCGQFLVAALISTVPMLVLEGFPSITVIKPAIGAVLYAGIMSSGLAFTFQIIGQKNTEPALASLLLCTESLFSVIFSILLPPHEKLKSVEYIGCLIMFTAVIIAQIKTKRKK